MAWLRKSAGLPVLFMLAACAPSDGSFIDKPDAQPDVTVSVAPGTTTETIAGQLQSMGFSISNRTEDSVSGETRGGNFVDCGRITQYRDGNKSEFPGSAAVAVLYSDPDSQDFLTRQFAVLSKVTVALAGNQATVRERHEITVLWAPSTGGGSKQQSKAVDGGETVTFEDGTSCATGTRVADRLR